MCKVLNFYTIQRSQAKENFHFAIKRVIEGTSAFRRRVVSLGIMDGQLKKIMMFDVPVLFLVFNRPDTTTKVFERIKAIRPSKLFIGADGPHFNKQGEKEKCEEVRAIILNGIDWPCEVKTLFRDKNLGCGRAISEAITWFFQNVEEGIILEDDCLPDPSFFDFCKTLLYKYRHVEQVKMISGDNFQMGNWRGEGSYFFSIRTHIWGWATWKRTWDQFNYSLSNLDKTTFHQILGNYFTRKKEFDYWKKIFSKVKNGEIDSWAYPFCFSIWNTNGVNIIPNTNLVSNIGFGENATHTKEKINISSNIPTVSISEIDHPTSVIISTEADQYYFDHYLDIPRPILPRIKGKIIRTVQKIKRKLGKEEIQIISAAITQICFL